MIDVTNKKIPPGQQLVGPGKWPIIGEKRPANSTTPWGLTLQTPSGESEHFLIDDLRSLKQTTIKMDIHCVTRWSRQCMEFTGVLLADLLSLTSLETTANFVSFIAQSERNHSTSLPLKTAIELNALIAMDVNGQPIPSDHGGPIRNIVPQRYFYKSVKWLTKIDLLPTDRLGFWEAETGYHNNADPWLEERYMAPTIDRRTAIKLIESRDFSGRDLRSIDARQRNLTGLKAASALLRDADFREADLTKADFTRANLSNAHFQQANLSESTFDETDLEGANLSGADLRNARFSRCSLIGCSFFDSRPDGSLNSAIIDSTTLFEDQNLEALTEPQKQFIDSNKNR